MGGGRCGCGGTGGSVAGRGRRTPPRGRDDRDHLAKGKAYEDRHQCVLDGCDVREQPTDEGADTAPEKQVMTPRPHPCHVENLNECKAQHRAKRLVRRPYSRPPSGLLNHASTPGKPLNTSPRKMRPAPAPPTGPERPSRSIGDTRIATRPTTSMFRACVGVGRNVFMGVVVNRGELNDATDGRGLHTRQDDP